MENTFQTVREEQKSQKDLKMDLYNKMINARIRGGDVKELARVCGVPYGSWNGFAKKEYKLSGVTELDKLIRRDFDPSFRSPYETRGERRKLLSKKVEKVTRVRRTNSGFVEEPAVVKEPLSLNVGGYKISFSENQLVITFE